MRSEKEIIDLEMACRKVLEELEPWTPESVESFLNGIIHALCWVRSKEEE